MRNEIVNEYFEWMYKMMTDGRFYPLSFRKLFRFLHNTEFIFSIDNDENRAEDGIYLRYRFAIRNGYDVDAVEDCLYGPCSILEMMIALAIRCEEEIMDNPKYGDRTGQWFWNMITSLGLGSMTDNNFDEYYVKDVVEKFLDRKYEPNGKGGLFTIRNCEHDLRDIEIWYQLCWYLDNIYE